VRSRLRRTHRLSWLITLALIASLLFVVLPFHLAFAGAVQVLAPVTDADNRLGLCDVLPGNTPGQNGVPWAQLAYNSGARINRWEFRWDREEPQRGQWTFAAMDPAVGSSLKYGLDVEGILIGTPGWAAAPGQLPGNGVPRGLYRSATDPRNLWAEYVRQTVQHYAGQIHFWEVWNEPDLHYFWTGSPQDYFRLLKVAYLVIKATDPGAQVLMAGMVVPDLTFVGQVLDAANLDPGAKQHSGYFDAVSWHAYGQAKLLYTNIGSFRQLLADKGYPNVPLWVTEDGFPASNPNGEPRQAAYVLQTIAYALSAGATRVLIYRASDDTTGKAWGLMSANGTPRLSYVAFQLAAQYFSHADDITYVPTDHLEQFAFYRPGQRVRVLWTHGVDDQQLAVEADQQTATLVDWSGTTTALAAVNGQYSLSLSGAHYNAGVDPAGSVVGGQPYLLVEDNTLPPNLTSRLWLTPISGPNRKLVLLNQGDQPVSAEVAAVTDPREHVVTQLMPHTVRSLDLDLLAGLGYGGMYVVSSSAPVQAEGQSNGTAVHALAASPTWIMPSAPPAITVGNATNKPVIANVVVYGARGVVRARARLNLQPSLRAGWGLPPDLAGDDLALTVRANGPVVVGAIDHAEMSEVTQPQTSWYAVQPRGARLSLFNPHARTAVQLDVRFVGSHALTGEQIHLAPHHLYILRTHTASAVVINATAGVTAGYTDRALSGPPASQPATQAALTTAGSVTRVAMFNPSQKVAHLSLALVGGAQVTQRTAVVAPQGVYTMQTRQSIDGPRGLVLTSDVPVVATAAS